MEVKNHIINRIVYQRMLPLFYHENKDVSIGVTRALYKAGIRVIEYTNRGAAAIENFCALKEMQQAELPDLILGIGTIRNSKEAEAFINAGADFLVSPIVTSEVAVVAASHKLLWIPGCMTPTEVHSAYNHGALLVKIFPAIVLGPEFISSIKEIFPGQLFMATGCGELSKENLNNWFNAGACAVGLGSKLITQSKMDNRDFEGLYQDISGAISLVN